MRVNKMPAPELYITNFNKNFTGVSATAAAVTRVQATDYKLCLVGHPLPNCPRPIKKNTAQKKSRDKPAQRKFAIWHVRRNPEMRAAIWARDVLRRPIKIVFTSSAQRYHSAYPRWLISKMDAVIATTDKAANFVPNVKAVVPHGVDTTLFQPSNNRSNDWSKLGFGGTHGIVTVGRVRPEKGTDRFVEAMLSYLPTDPTCHALILGKTSAEFQSFKKELLSKIEAASLTDRIHFLGEKPQSEIANILRASDLLIALPRYEGYGVTPLEALASGVSFIGTDVGGFKSFTQKGNFGQIVPEVPSNGDIWKWLNHKDNFSRFAHDFVDERFSAKIEASEIGKVYDKLWDCAL